MLARRILNPGRLSTSVLLLAISAAAVVPAHAQTAAQEFTICPNGCQALVLPGGNQLIAEGGAMPNRASLIQVDPNGDQLALPLLTGLPSGRAADGVPFGPVAYTLNGQNLFIALGEADPFHNAGPSFINRAPLTPFVSSILQVTFSADLLSSGPFLLQPADSQRLQNGQTVTLWDFVGHSATLQQIAILGAGAHPTGLVTIAGSPNSLYVVDSSTRQLYVVNLTTHDLNQVAQFPLKPESLRAYDDSQFLVTLYDENHQRSSVWLLNPLVAGSRLVAENLNSPVDAIAGPNSGQTAVYVLQNSGDSQGLGQVVSIDGGTVTVLAAGLNDPTAMWADAVTNRLFVFSRGDGVIYSIPLQ